MSTNRVQWNQPEGRASVHGAESVVVVGGGIAGLASAAVLAERGVKVTLIEKQAYLGGRAGSWQDTLEDGTDFEMERGFHAFFRQYYNLRNLLKRVDPELSFLKPTRDYPLFGPNGAKESFSDLPKRAPWNLMKLVLRSPSIRLRDLLRLNHNEAQQMLAYDPVQTYERYDNMSAAEYLDSLNFPQQARRMLFDVFAHSFFNPEADFSAGELIMMFHYYFLGNPEGIVFDVADGPFGRVIWEPLARYLQDLGVQIQRGTCATRVDPIDTGWCVHTDDGDELTAHGVVLALPVPALQGLVQACEGLDHAGWRHDIAQLGVTRPFSVWRLWMDRSARPERAPFVGTTGLGIVDNISLYEQLEDESRAWSDAHGGSVVEIHAYSVPESMSASEIKADMRAQLDALYPEFKTAEVLEERFLHHQDCPAFGPGSHAKRPTVQTPFKGLTLAGDYVKTPFPTALMERATATGFMAANQLLEAWGVQAETLYSVPLTGMLAGRGRRAPQLASGLSAPSTP